MSQTDWSEVRVSELPTGTVTLLLADVEGSTRLWQTQPEEMSAAVALLDRTLAEVVAAHGGVRPVEQGEGDSFVIAFAHAGDAVACALEVQRVPLAPIRLRIGVHTGDVQLRDEGNYIGPTINRTARLRDLAHGGQTVLSAATEQLVVDWLPADAWLTDLGTHQLRDFPRPERVVQLCHPDIRNEFPSLRDMKSVAVHNVPAQLTSFVGRGPQIADVTRLLTEDRLVTLTGAGGAGKTRLAVEAATRLASQLPDGVWYVDLAPITHADVVPVAAARALGLPDHPGRSTDDTLIQFIGDRRLLMVLDNCEHLLDASASLARSLLGACPELRLLTTSREPLGITGEVSFVVPSLSLADEAIELFTDRARHADPEFIAEDNAATVTEICRRLDGMPLAIELAAARVRALTLDEILDGLHDRFRLLTGGARRAVRRQQTLHASVDWSHALLTETERILLRRLAVFLGGFELSAAHAVAGDEGMQRYQVLDQLTLLVDKSLLVAENSGGRTRYRLLETVRQYALEKLGESGESDTVSGRHRDYYTAMAIQLDAPADTGHARRLEQAEIEIDNLRSAFAWSLENADTVPALRLAASLQPLWFTRWRIREGLVWLDAALSAATGEGAEKEPARLRAVIDKGLLRYWLDATQWPHMVDDALALAREIGDTALVIRALVALGAVYAIDFEVARAHFLEAGRLARKLDDRWRLSQVLAGQALAGVTSGDAVAIDAAAHEGCELAESIGDDFNSRQCRICLGVLYMYRGDLTRSVTYLRDVVAEATAAHDPWGRSTAQLSMAFALAYHGDVDAAQEAVDAIVGDDFGELIDRSGYAAIGTIRLAAGDAAAANEAFEAALQRTRLAPATAPIYAFAALAPLAYGDLVTARQRAEDVVALTKDLSLANALLCRAHVEIAQDEMERAGNDVRQALDIIADLQGYLSLSETFECLAYIAGDAGSHREAARLFGAAGAARRRTGVARFKTLDADYDRRLAAVRDSLGESEFNAAWDEGAALSIQEAIAYVRRGRGERRSASSGWGSLTPAELDVVRLVREGLSNKDIGARLFVSPRTVQTHLTHVYTKLGFTSRMQLAQEAARHT